MVKSLLLASVLIASAAFATPVLALPIVSVVGAGTIGLVPSADTLTLSSATNAATVGSFNFQPGSFNIGDSGALIGTITGSLTEAIIIGKSKGFIMFNYSDAVTAATDTLSITSTPTRIGDYTLTVMPFQLPGSNFGSTPFELQATLNSTPEPTALALFGLSVLALAFARHK